MKKLSFLLLVVAVLMVSTPIQLDAGGSCYKPNSTYARCTASGNALHQDMYYVTSSTLYYYITAAYGSGSYGQVFVFVSGSDCNWVTQEVTANAGSSKSGSLCVHGSASWVDVIARSTSGTTITDIDW